MIDVSVIVPVYNTERYVARCISSILAQTSPNLELILIDDGSKDNSGEICDSYAAKDNRVRVVHKENGGVSAARNLGLSMARGEFISFIDSDDWIAPDTYELALETARRNNVDLVQFNFCNVNDGIVREVKSRHIVGGEYEMPLRRGKYHSGWLSMCYKLVRRTLFDGLEFYPWSYQCEDAAMCILLYSRVKSVWIVDDVCYFRISRSDSALHTIDRAGYENRIRTFNALAEDLCKEGRDCSFIDFARRKERRNMLKARLKSFGFKHRF